MLNKKLKTKYYVWTAAVLYIIGFFIASQTQSVGMLYFGFGILAGFASGLAYNAVMSTMSAWFPDKQGLISGILLMGFGLGSFIIGKVYTAWTPAEIGGWRTSFRVFAILWFIIMIIGGFFFVKPGEDFVPPTAGKKKVVREPASEINTPEMMKKPSFWLYYIWAILVSAAGLALVSQASGIAWQVGPEVFGALFDKFGYRLTMILDMIIFIITGVILIMALLSGNFALIVIGFVVGGLAYGGVTPTNSAIISDFFGRKNYPMNFSVINTNLIIASFGSTIAGKLFDASGSYMSTCAMMIGLTVVGFVMFLGIRRPNSK
jgi:OFA family oxalate/formate antiporter-like MFS transporter